MDLRFDNQGLIPAIVQDAVTGRVLMFAFMNRESLELTRETGLAHFWSRSRQSLWQKGESSGNKQKVVSIAADCDGDCLLLSVEPQGPACHTGAESCFFVRLFGPELHTVEMLGQLWRVIAARRAQMPENSYTASLFRSGLDAILKKFGEEAIEVILAAKNGARAEVRHEVADLLYHLLVMLAELELDPSEVYGELSARRG